MPETSEKPRVDIRQVITSPQFLAGLSTAIANTRSSGYETLLQTYLNNGSGRVLYHPEIAIGYREQVGTKPIKDRDEREFERTVGYAIGGRAEQMRRTFRPTSTPFPKNCRAEFIPLPINLAENQFLLDAHTHPAYLNYPSRDDLECLNKMRKANSKNQANAVNPISAIVSVPLCEWRDPFQVLFIQESSQQPLDEKLVKTIPESLNWSTSRHSNQHYNQAEALFDLNKRELRVTSEPFTLFV